MVCMTTINLSPAILSDIIDKARYVVCNDKVIYRGLL